MLVFLPLVERLTGIESNKNILFIKKALANLPELFFIIKMFTSNLFLMRSYLENPLIACH